MSERGLTGLLIVGHGSRRSEANRDVRDAARQIGCRGGFPLVEAAFLEIERPEPRATTTARQGDRLPRQ